MIPNTLRVLLVLGSLCTVLFMLRRIRHSKVQIRDSVFWIFFSALLLLLSVFPQIAGWASRLLGFEAPINFVYLVIIFCLLVRVFGNSVRISQLDSREKLLAQQLALEKKLREEMQAALQENTGAGQEKK